MNRKLYALQIDILICSCQMYNVYASVNPIRSYTVVSNQFRFTAILSIKLLL